jgi:hypothetical protein
VRKLIRLVGDAKLFVLSKYSPDLSPIEKVFAQAQLHAAQGSRPNRARRSAARSAKSSTGLRLPTGSQFSAVDAVQHLIVQAQIGHDPEKSGTRGWFVAGLKLW